MQAADQVQRAGGSPRAVAVAVVVAVWLFRAGRGRVS